MEQENLALQTLEQVNAAAEERKTRATRLHAAMTRAQLAREERAVETPEEEAPQDVADFCASRQPQAAAPDLPEHVGKTKLKPQLA